MPLTYTDEQEEFRGVLRRLLQDHSPSTEVRRLMETEAGWDATLWRRLADDLGVPGLHLPESLGGQAFTAVEQGIVLQELGRALACSPYFGSIALAAAAIEEAGSEADRQALLPGLASGAQTAALGVCEPGGGWDAESIATIATPAEGGLRLHGVKSYVVDGHTADRLVIVARMPGTSGAEGITFSHFASEAQGVTCTRLESVDATRKLARVELDGVRAEPLGEPGAGASALARSIDRAAVALANEMVGGAERLLEMTVEYAKTRVQFGRPIGSFQAIKHKCADMLVDVELARSAAIQAASALAEGRADLPEVAALAKALVGDAYVRVAAEAIQIHGGIGFTWEHDCHLYFKRARSSVQLLGDGDVHRERMWGALTGEEARA